MGHSAVSGRKTPIPYHQCHLSKLSCTINSQQDAVSTHNLTAVYRYSTARSPKDNDDKANTFEVLFRPKSFIHAPLRCKLAPFTIHPIAIACIAKNWALTPNLLIPKPRFEHEPGYGHVHALPSSGVSLGFRTTVATPATSWCFPFFFPNNETPSETELTEDALSAPDSHLYHNPPPRISSTN